MQPGAQQLTTYALPGGDRGSVPFGWTGHSCLRPVHDLLVPGPQRITVPGNHGTSVSRSAMRGLLCRKSGSGCIGPYRRPSER